MERIKQQAKVDITHVPYQPAQAVGAAVAGHTQISSTSMPPAVSQVKGGRVRALAVTSAQRSPALPEVPTVAEAGLPDFEVTTWYGVLAPAGTPRNVINRLNGELVKIMHAPELKEKLTATGTEPLTSTPDEFAAYIQKEIAKWGDVIRKAGVKAD